MNTLRFAALLLSPALTLAPFALAVAQPQPQPQQQQQQQRADAPEPPRLEKLEEGDAPAVTIPGRQSEQQIEERRDHGEVVSTKVHSGGSTYYLKPNKPKGSAQPGDVQSTANTPAQWQIMEFNTRRRDQVQTDPNPTPAPAGTPGVAR